MEMITEFEHREYKFKMGFEDSHDDPTEAMTLEINNWRGEWEHVPDDMVSYLLHDPEFHRLAKGAAKSE